MVQDMMRDPAGNTARYAAYFALRDELKAAYLEKFPTLPLDAQVQSKIGYNYNEQEYAVHLYAAGMPLAPLAAATAAAVVELNAIFEFTSGHLGKDAPAVHPVNGQWRLALEFAGLALLLLETREELACYQRLISPLKTEQSYLFDLLAHAFIPQHLPAKKYKTDKTVAAWSDPVLRALAMPPEQRPAALAAHMKNWPRIMRPFGWKPDLNTAEGKDNLFWHFAFEVALAVCGWDIDDSSFRDHPYYPRDLVEYYRANLRRTRDGWRAHQAGAGVAVQAPPPPAKTDLAKTRRKGLARWVELVADGDQDAVEAVLEITGKPRKVKDFDQLMCALQDSNLAIQADLRDDETVGLQADGLAGARNLGAFDFPPGPPFGGTRCTALLRAWDAWLAQRGYQAVDLDGDDDAWHVVVVKAEYRAELLALSAELGIAAREPAAAWPD